MNIDTLSLSNISDERYFGLIATGLRLVGNQSGAIALITGQRLVTDASGNTNTCMVNVEVQDKFGPDVSCGNIGQAIRCSSTNPQAANQGNNLTGMNGASIDTSEGPGRFGDSFVRWLDVQAGETYFIVINRAEGNSGFNLEWTGTATFSEPPTDESTNPSTSNPTNLSSCDVITPFKLKFSPYGHTLHNNAI